MWLLSTGNMANETEEITVKFYLALINLNVIIDVHHVSIILDRKISSLT